MRDWKKFVRGKLPPLRLSGAREQEIVEELALQLEQSYGEAIARGAASAEAEALAAAQIRDWKALGIEIRRAETPVVAAAAKHTPNKIHFDAQEMRLRKSRGGNAMADFLQDLRYAFRMLRKSPGLTAVVILTLALGIGANSAIFSVVNGVLLRPLPYRDANKLVWISDYLPAQKMSAVFDVDYFAMRKHGTSFEEMTAYEPGGGEFTLSGVGDAERLNGVTATHTFLRTLGVTPQIGRDIAAEEDKPNSSHVALLSDSLWHRRFSADVGIVGRTITLDGNEYAIIGVLPKGFEFPEDRNADLLVPMAAEDVAISPNQPIAFVRIIGRLKPGVMQKTALAQLDTILRPFHTTFPGGFAKLFAGAQVEVMSLQDRLVGDVRKSLLLLLGAVGFVLLIACANVASLQLARAASREKEIAVRGALGAGRWRLARQLLTESALIGLAGGAAGLALGVWVVALVRHYGPQNIPHLDVTYLDGRVVLFTMGVSLLTGILFGLAPVVSAFRLSLNESLKQGSAQGSAGRKVVRPQQALMTLELAMALVLLIGAGLLARSFVRLATIPPGFDPHGVITARIVLPPKTYLKGDQQRTFYSQLMERIQGIPGISSAGAAAALPLNGFVRFSGAVQVEGQSATRSNPGNPWRIAQNMASPGYFDTLRIPLKAGRYVDRRDGSSAPEALVVNEKFVQQFIPNENPIGRRVQFGRSIGGNDWWTIVGVVEDMKQSGLAAETLPETFFPFSQSPFPDMTLAIRTDADPRMIVPTLREAVAAVDKDVPLSRVETLDDMLSGQVESQRFNMALLGAFAALALLLAGVGIYGVMAYAVGQRTQEIGIRMALGALPGNVLRMVLVQGARLAIFGVVLGVAGGIGLTRLLRTLLFEVKPTDTATFVVCALILFAAAIVACWIPARRATRVDPLIALRYE